MTTSDDESIDDSAVEACNDRDGGVNGNGRSEMSLGGTPDGWEAFASRLRAYVAPRVAPAAVDDLVGDIALRLMQHREDWQAADDHSAWMMRVASNAVTDHYRRCASEARALPRAGGPMREADERGVEDIEDAEVHAGAGVESDGAAGRRLARGLGPMIDALPAPYSEALRLTDIEGLTQAEAAERLGVTLSAMKSRVRRGREKLKAALLACCAVEVDRRGGVLDYRPRGDACGCDDG